MRPPPIERFKRFTDVGSEDCWLWRGTIDGNGYGRFFVSGRPVRAHRWAYEYWCGRIPRRLEIDHLCRVRHCVNPWHLEAVTHPENVRRGLAGSLLKIILDTTQRSE
jgi:hypothetical protein